MAELTHFYAEDNTVHDGGSGWTTALSISGASLTANTKYLIVARGVEGSDSAATLAGTRVSTADDSTIATKSASNVEHEQTAAADGLSYFFSHSYTTDASPADVLLESLGTTSTLDQMSLFLLDLDAIGTAGTDYFEDVQAVDGTTEYESDFPTNPATILAEIAGSDMGTAEHLILGYARADVGSTGRWFDISLATAMDAATNAEVAKHRAEGEDTTEQRIVGFAARHKASSGTPNATIVGTEEAANGNMFDGGAYLIALPTALFADFEFKYESGNTAGLDGNEGSVAPLGAYTPTVGGNHLILGQANGVQTPTALGGIWVEAPVPTEMRTGDSAVTQNQIWDNAKDDELMNTFQRVSIAASEEFYFLRAQGAGADFELTDSWLIVVNLNEAGGGGDATATPTTVAAAGSLTGPTVTADALHVATEVAAPSSLAAPTVTADALMTPATVDVAASLAAPTITLSATATPVTVPAPADLPTPTVTAGALTTPALLDIPPDVPAPNVDIGVTATPATISVAPDVPAPTVTLSATATPATVDAPASLTAPTVTADALTTSSTTVDVPNDVPAPVISVGADASATVIQPPADVPAPTITLSATATPAAIGPPADVPVPTVTADALATPATVAAPASLATPTVTADALATPATVAAPASLAAPTVTAGATPTPTTVDAPASLAAPAVTADSLATPTTITVPNDVPNPVVIISGGGDATATPTTVDAPASLATPTITLSATATPATVAAPASLAVPTVTADALATPATIGPPPDVPAPTVTADVLATPTVVGVSAELAAPTLLTGVGPIVTPLTVSVQAFTNRPRIKATGVVAPDPTLGRVNGYAKGLFYRRTSGDNAPILMFVPVGRSQQIGMKSGETHEIVSDVFVYTQGTRDDIMELMDVDWAADKASTNAVLKLALNTKLDFLGFKGPAGVSLI